MSEQWQPKSGRGEGVKAADLEEKKGTSAALAVAVLGIGCFGLVFVIGILAAIAIPNFVAMQQRAKRAEAPSMVDGLRTAEKAYHAEFDAFFAAPLCPADIPGMNQRPWQGDCTAAFDAIGWQPGSDPRCSYAVEADSSSARAEDHDFTVRAYCDIDGDGVQAVYEATRADYAQMVTPNNIY